MTHETLELMEEKLADALCDLGSYGIGTEERAACQKEIDILSEKLGDLIETCSESQDREQRQKIDAKKIEIEEKRSNKNRVVDILKISVPAAVTAIGYCVYKSQHDKMLELNEHGYISTKTGIESKLPNIGV